MKINIKYLDNTILFDRDKITVLEVYNKKYFYRIINDLNNLSLNQDLDNIYIFDIDSQKEIKPILYINYFNFEFDSKKNITDINKYTNKLINEEEKTIILKELKKISKIYNKKISLLDLPLKLSDDVNFDDLIKLFKIEIDYKNDLLFNLLLLIDIENIFKTNKLLIFVNLKDYLTEEELIEFYKYSLYNQINIMLIDINKHPIISKYEVKYIIDENLDEFMV